MKSQNMHLLLGVLLFASLCGAPKKGGRTPVTRFKGAHRAAGADDKMPSVFGVMNNARVQKPKPPKSKMSRESTEKVKKHVAATKIQAVVRGNKARKKLGVKPRSGSDASSVSARSRSRSVSPKGRKGAATSAPVADPTETTDGILG